MAVRTRLAGKALGELWFTSSKPSVLVSGPGAAPWTRGTTDAPPRGPRPGPSLVPERAAASVVQGEDRPPPPSLSPPTQ